MGGRQERTPWRIRHIGRGAKQLLKMLPTSEWDRMGQELTHSPKPTPGQERRYCKPLAGPWKGHYEYCGFSGQFRDFRVIYRIDEAERAIDLVDGGPHKILEKRE